MSPSKSPETIELLLVDDKESVRDALIPSLTDHFSALGYSLRITYCSSADEARTSIDDVVDPFAVAIVAIRHEVPSESLSSRRLEPPGLDIVTRVRRASPESVVVGLAHDDTGRLDLKTIDTDAGFDIVVTYESLLQESPYGGIARLTFSIVELVRGRGLIAEAVDGHSERAPRETSGPPLSTSSRCAIEYAAHFADRRADRQGHIDATLVLLGSLAYARDVNLPGVTSALLRQLSRGSGRDPELFVQRMASAAGVGDIRGIGAPGVGKEEFRDPVLSALLRQARHVASRVEGRTHVSLRHLITAAVVADRPPLSRRVLDELGVTPAQVRDSLLGSIRAAAPRGADLKAWSLMLGTATALAGGIASDRVDPRRGIPIANDHLGVGTDASMLATVIVDRRTSVPLSVGIFGEWGSGKSYFMGLMRAEVERMSSVGEGECLREVVQIGFNAWHYADSNLWASLGDEIFRQLAAPSELAGNRRSRLGEELGAKLEERRELEARTRHARNETIRLQGRLDAAIADREARMVDLLRAVAASGAARESLKRVWRRLGVSDEIDKATIFAGQVRGTAREATTLRRSLARQRIWVWSSLATVAAALLLISLLVPPRPIAWLTRGVATLFGVGALGFFVRVRRGLNELRKVIDDVNKRTDEAIDNRLASQVNSIVGELRSAEADQRVAQAQLDQVVAEVGALGRQYADLMPGHRLYSFIRERAAGDAYASQLGLISKMRRDLEHLVELMDDWRNNPVDHESRRPIDRIVLYIDDLDRCSPAQVVDVLQAVHLLLAIDLFVVVVGVDPRWLLRSLRVEFERILAADLAEGSHESKSWEMTPNDYLEKIFGIPLMLPGMTAGSMGRMIRGLAGTPDNPRPAVVNGSGAGDQTSWPVGSGAIPVEASSELATSGSEARRPLRPLTEPELVLLSELEYLVETPREAKRVFNLYRMVRSTRDLSGASRFLGEDGDPGDYQAVVVLLGLLTAHARLLGHVLDAQPHPPSILGGLMFWRPNTPWHTFAASIKPRREGEEWVNNIIGTISRADLEVWRQLYVGLDRLDHLVTLRSVESLQLWAARVRRFSFGLLSRLPAA
jgi:KAP-like P-loop domain-containing protein